MISWWLANAAILQEAGEAHWSPTSINTNHKYDQKVGASMDSRSICRGPNYYWA